MEVVEESLKGNVVRLLGQRVQPALDLPKIRRNALVEIVPISVGCLNNCTYCKTKHARGDLGSYGPEAIVARVEQVGGEGVLANLGVLVFVGCKTRKLRAFLLSVCVHCIGGVTGAGSFGCR